MIYHRQCHPESNILQKENKSTLYCTGVLSSFSFKKITVTTDILKREKNYRKASKILNHFYKGIVE